VGSTTGSVTLANALTIDGSTCDVRIVNGVVHSLHPAGGAPPAAEQHDLSGRLLLPGFADPHVHLDKALTARFAPTHAVGLDGAIDAHRRVVDLDVNGHDLLVHRACEMLERLLLNGVLAVRSHVNVGDGLGLHHLAAMREAADRYRDVMTVQLFAMVHTPLGGDDGRSNRQYLRQALDRFSPDGIGGCPHLDPSPESALEVLFGAASDSGLPLDLHTDETTDPAMFTLPSVAALTDSAGLHGRVTASHCVSLSTQSAPVQAATADALAASGVSVVVLPQTNLYLNSVGVTTAPARALAPATTLVEAGVVVAAGSDNLQDPLNPVGDADPLHTASLMVVAAHQLPGRAVDQVSTTARALMGLPAAGLAIGMEADLVALHCGGAAEAIAECPADRMVFRRGRLVAASTVNRTVWR